MLKILVIWFDTVNKVLSATLGKHMSTTVSFSRRKTNRTLSILTMKRSVDFVEKKDQMSICGMSFS